MEQEKSSKKDERTRNWTFIVYPDSAPEKWQGLLDVEHIQWIESPLHKSEINPDSESEKKPHYHILLLFEGKKSYEQVKSITIKLNATTPQICKNAKGLVRYMAHLDNPEKKQYSTSEIIGHGGADVISYLKPTSSSRYQLISEMMNFVKENKIIELKDLLDYAMSERFDDWFPLLCDNSAYIMGEYIKSHRHGIQSTNIIKVNSKTGEVIE